jgi:hypothetical protein
MLETRHLSQESIRDLGVDGIILKMFLKKQREGVWSKFISEGQAFNVVNKISQYPETALRDKKIKLQAYILR